jgi:hypothetical protein
MSTPGSPAPSDAVRAQAAADRARLKPPVAADPRFDAVRRAETGTPALVRAPDGSPAYWLVPFDLDGRACGVARVALDARHVDVSTFGPAAADHGAWPHIGFFARVPADVVDAASASHPGLRWAPPLLSYDGSPHKWAWRVEAESPGALVIFITPGGWYVSPAAPLPEDREG